MFISKFPLQIACSRTNPLVDTQQIIPRVVKIDNRLLERDFRQDAHLPSSAVITLWYFCCFNSFQWWKMYRKQVYLDYDSYDCKGQITWQHHLLCHTLKRSRNGARRAQKCHMCKARYWRGQAPTHSLSPQDLTQYQVIALTQSWRCGPMISHCSLGFHLFNPTTPQHRKILVCNS